MRLPWRRDDVVVLGQELADATDREEQHRRAMGDVESPLAGVAYDAARGELDLHRFVPSPTDDEIRAFLSGYTPDMRAALHQDDFYRLLAFAGRTVLAVMRGADNARLEEARAAIRAVDVERVDWRDVAVASALVDDPDSSGYVRVETPDGPGLVLSPATSAASDDLTTAAFALQDVLEQDVYRVADISGGDDVPSVWFSGPVDRELGALRATMALTARLAPAASAEADSQQLTVFLAETATEADATRLAGAAVPSEWFEALGVAAGRVCCVTVARSWVDGVAPYEAPGALERFREPFTAALGASSRSWRMLLVLWDIDGTLVDSAGHGRHAFEEAFQAVTGGVPEWVEYAGRTDHQIARSMLEGSDPSAEHLPAVLDQLAERLAARKELIAAEGHVYPGVPETLAALHAHDGVVNSLLTGNIEPNAAVKVGAFGLDRWLDFEAGAYGSDPHERRSDLVAVARERAAERYGEPTGAVLVGDTPLDVLAAREAGARAVAVATGFAELDALRESEPDALLQDLSDTDAAIRAITGAT